MEMTNAFQNLSGKQTISLQGLTMFLVLLKVSGKRKFWIFQILQCWKSY